MQLLFSFYHKFILIYLCVSSISCQSNKHQEQSQEQSQEQPKIQEKQAWVFIGDSLTAGFGLSIDEAFVALLDQRFQKEGIAWKLRNAGVSGDTSAGVLRRVDWLIDDQVKRAFICIGANDGLRGQSVDALYQNLKEIIKKLKDKKVEVILAGIKMPINYGEDYRQKFESVYQKVAQEESIPFLPFLLEGVAADPTLNLEDGIHPNRKGQEKIAEHVYRFLMDKDLISKNSKGK